jgi:hypothetical protein
MGTQNCGCLRQSLSPLIGVRQRILQPPFLHCRVMTPCFLQGLWNDSVSSTFCVGIFDLE